MGLNGSGDIWSLTAILAKVLRWRSKKPLISDDPPITTIQKKTQLSAGKNLKFSESKAYFGIDKRELLNETVVVSSKSTLKAFDAATHKQKKDYNGFLNAPKYEVVPTLKRYVLRQQIKDALKDGKDTTYLKAALEYVDVEEAIYRAEEGAFTLDN
ncbi:hypothetical protein DINM_006147 [Dirofilaria immitis]|nr:hypothetical protein [Dirofilaria immitis]